MTQKYHKCLTELKTIVKMSTQTSAYSESKADLHGG